MVFPIVTGLNNPILRTKSVPIVKIDRNLAKFAKDMIETMEKSEDNGVGLAAPQVGRNERLIVVKVFRDRSLKTYTNVIMINPVVTFLGDKKEVAEEGCLSLPRVSAQVERYFSLRVTFQDVKDKTQILELHGWNARIVQHEVDHLDGILFPDRALPGTLIDPVR